MVCGMFYDINMFIEALDFDYLGKEKAMEESEGNRRLLKVTFDTE